MSKYFSDREKRPLIERSIEGAIEKALEEISNNMHSELECRCSYSGDAYYISNPFIDKNVDLRVGLDKYVLPLTCTYKEVYKFVENIIKDKLYDRDDDDSNKPVVYVHSVSICDYEVEILMTVRLLQTKYDGTTADVSVMR